MLPDTIHGVRFLELYPEYTEPFIDARLSVVLLEITKDEKHASKIGTRIALWSRLFNLVCPQQKEILFELDNIGNDIGSDETRACYLQGWQDGLRYAGKEA